MNKPVYIIAEIGVNHQGDLTLAKKMVDAAKQAGADAAKFQCFIAEKCLSQNIEKAAYQINNTGSGSQYEMVKQLELSFAEHKELKDYCDEKNIDYLSTAFDFESLNFLHDSMPMPYLKIASGEITNHPFLLAHARTDANIILSTGMSNLEEIEKALAVLAFGFLNKQKQLPTKEDFYQALHSSEGQLLVQRKVTILHCTTEYPAPFDEVNLAAIEAIKNRFGCAVGYSDHTAGIAIPIAAASLGACVIEKHFTLDRSMPGPDHKASIEPDEFASMVQGVRQVCLALGDGEKRASQSEIKNIKQVRKVVLANKAIAKGEKFTTENLCLKRGSGNCLPENYWELLGKVADRSYASEQAINWPITHF